MAWSAVVFGRLPPMGLSAAPLVGAGAPDEALRFCDASPLLEEPFALAVGAVTGSETAGESLWTSLWNRSRIFEPSTYLSKVSEAIFTNRTAPVQDSPS